MSVLHCLKSCLFKSMVQKSCDLIEIDARCFSSEKSQNTLKFTKNTYLNGLANDSGSCNSVALRVSHEKCSPQLKPPFTIGDAVYSKVSDLMMSIIGHTTVFLSFAIRLRSGGSQSTFTSQWLSRNTRTYNKR